MYNLSIFAERLEELMLDNGFTSKSLATYLDVDVSTVNHYLSGRFLPHTDLLIKIADCFKCPADYLLGDGENFTCKNYAQSVPFAERLNFIMSKTNCSQYRLHKETKIADTLITYWRRGVYTPSVDNLIKLATYFKCSVDYLIGRTNT